MPAPHHFLLGKSAKMWWKWAESVNVEPKQKQHQRKESREITVTFIAIERHQCKYSALFWSGWKDSEKNKNGGRKQNWWNAREGGRLKSTAELAESDKFRWTEASPPISFQRDQNRFIRNIRDVHLLQNNQPKTISIKYCQTASTSYNCFPRIFPSTISFASFLH